MSLLRGNIMPSRKIYVQIAHFTFVRAACGCRVSASCCGVFLGTERPSA